MTLMLSEPMLHAHIAPAGPERRRGLRIRQARTVKLFDGSAAKFVAGQTRDISATGLRIDLPLQSDVACEDIVYVHVDSFEHRRQMSPAKIVWLTRTATRRGAHLTAGVEFLDGLSNSLNAA